MELLTSICGYITKYHIISIAVGLFSAIQWFLSTKVKAKPIVAGVELTNPDPKKNVNLHQHFETLEIQTKYNSRAAFAAAVAVILQGLGI
ncbi:hypothetical protein 8AX10_8 [uncultured Caudovirales phage]|uniref:Uncharacterized protein n=1 Tax=uncultured Caudovirales phage TaxID=2100421 RepID=A0A2H4J199_9CAUD|nr:hypothetical protein [Pantoea sp. MT58]ASN67478.1 hypothetical protein 8AX10_8 [uncultured Caudovirales phage]ASN68762.1 hypothetical protein 7AX3_25 [uncultured Caudovirales phage]QNQ59774.1 hypothetical protein IAI47_05895 [Pantoea sp. MT58]